MRAVVQRVKRCSVTVDGERVSGIGEGLLILLGVAEGDGPDEADYLADKILNLRIFPDESERMNLSLIDKKGEVMVVSQFTLLADCRKGRRPSFTDAADPRAAEALYLEFARRLESPGIRVETGAFGRMMVISLENWGPVTIVVDTPD